MRQVIRLMDMPDKVIAFDELPEELVKDLELNDCSKLPREWREFIGYREKTTRIPPDRDPFTGQMRTYTPIVTKGPFAYIVDREINADRERWAAIVAYTRKNAPVSWKQNGESVKLMDDIEKMAKPMGRDAHSELDLEPEQVTVIPLIKSGAVAEPEVATVKVAPSEPEPVRTPVKGDVLKISPVEYKCDQCEKVFDKEQGLRLHKTVKHAKVIA